MTANNIDMSKKSLHEKLVQAWENTPRGAKGRIFNMGWSRELVFDIVKNGRKDESIIDQLMNAIKQGCKDYASDVARANKKIQQL